VWLPAGRAMARVAVPPERVAVPRVVAPSLKVTVPDGVPPPGATAVTVAVTFRGWPETKVPPAAATAVWVDALPTVCVSTVELEAA